MRKWRVDIFKNDCGPNETSEDHAEEGREPPSDLARDNARFLKERFTGAFSALVSTRKGDGHIYLGDLAHKLYERTNRDWEAKLKRYLRVRDGAGGRPNMESAWMIGEVLRIDCGVEWSSGLWMLYASGRLEDFVGVLGEFIDDSVNRPAEVNHREMQHLWQLLACVEDLTATTSYDVKPEFAATHRTCFPENESYLRPARKSRVLGTLDFYAYDSREAAKCRWLLHALPYVPRLETAYENWRQRRRGPREMTLMDGAVSVARSSEFDIRSKEHVVFKIMQYVLAEWLNSDDVIEDLAFNGGPPPRYWRAIHLRGIW